MYIQDVDLKLKDWAFSQRKNLPWIAKQNLTETRIIDWANYWDGQVYVSFSGGLDSTVLLHFVRKVLGMDIPAVFCDTGLEYPELRDFVKTFDNNIILKPNKTYRQVIKEYGYPVASKEVAAKVRKLRHGNLSNKYRNYLLNGDTRGKFGKLSECWKFLLNAPFETSEKCCDVMKKNPFRDYHKQTGRYPYIGTTQDEGFQREHQYSKTGCNVFDANKPKSQPLGFWTKQDILIYLIEHHDEILEIIRTFMRKTGASEEQIKKRIHPWASCYGDIVKINGELRTTGEQRTGCMFCGFGAHMEQCPNRFQRMAVTHNQYWKYCMKSFDDGGLGLGTVLDVLNVPYEPDVVLVGGREKGYQQFVM